MTALIQDFKQGKGLSIEELVITVDHIIELRPEIVFVDSELVMEEVEFLRVFVDEHDLVVSDDLFFCKGTLQHVPSLALHVVATE